KMQMIAVDDIGKFGAKAFVDADQMKDVEVDIGGDAVTMPEAATIVSELMGRTITFQPIPVAAVRQNSEDLGLMLDWFEATGCSADIPSMEQRFGIRPLTLKEWARARRR